MNPSSRGRAGGVSFQLGLHVSIAGGLERIFERGESLACGVVQIFSHSSRSWEFQIPEKESLLSYLKFRHHSSVSRVFIHASYLINIASDDPVILERSRETLKKELLTADRLHADGLVLHPGSAKNGARNLALQRASALLREVLDSVPTVRTPLLLENTAGAGSMLGSTPQELKLIFDAVDRPERMGLCLDSCHLFASGFDISSRDVTEQVLREFLRAVPTGKISLWHLNDALYGLGSGKDRHAGLGEGTIGLPALTHIVLDALKNEIPLILETPKGEEGEELDRENLRRLYSMSRLPVPDILVDAR